MSAVTMDGVATATQIKEELRIRVAALNARGVTPGLGTLLVGDDPASHSYVTGKHRDCAEVGIASVRAQLPESATFEEVAAAVRGLNADPAVTGFIVQLPLPDGMDEKAILELIDPAKDADGLHPVNLGRLVLGVDGRGNSPLPCTPAGIIRLCGQYGVALAGKTVAVIGRGITVGRPLGLMLARRGIDATVIQAHSRTPDLAAVVRSADVVVAAAGMPHLVRPEWLRPGAAVLDVGVTRVGTSPSGKAKLAGDVDPGAREVAGFLSPNPGGVGPMTRAMLVANVVQMAEVALDG